MRSLGVARPQDRWKWSPLPFVAPAFFPRCHLLLVSVLKLRWNANVAGHEAAQFFRIFPSNPFAAANGNAYKLCKVFFVCGRKDIWRTPADTVIVFILHLAGLAALPGNGWWRGAKVTRGAVYSGHVVVFLIAASIDFCLCLWLVTKQNQSLGFGRTLVGGNGGSAYKELSDLHHKVRILRLLFGSYSCNALSETTLKLRMSHLKLYCKLGIRKSSPSYSFWI